jgi:hypothetical protein
METRGWPHSCPSFRAHPNGATKILADTREQGLLGDFAYERRRPTVKSPVQAPANTSARSCSPSSADRHRQQRGSISRYDGIPGGRAAHAPAQGCGRPVRVPRADCRLPTAAWRLAAVHRSWRSSARSAARSAPDGTKVATPGDDMRVLLGNGPSSGTGYSGVWLPRPASGTETHRLDGAPARVDVEGATRDLVAGRGSDDRLGRGFRHGDGLSTEPTEHWCTRLLGLVHEWRGRCVESLMRTSAQALPRCGSARAPHLAECPF